jgi:hypothetical protein
MTLRGMLASAVAVTLVHGCAFVEVREVSRPTLERTAGAAAVDKDSYIILPGVMLAVAARNERTTATLVGPGMVVPLPVIPVPVGTPAPRGSHFWIEVAIDPEGEAFTFDPGEVGLRLGQGPAFRPLLMKGPAAVFDKSGRRSSDRLCGLDPTDEIRAPARVRVAELSCYALGFEIATPGADEDFDLSVNGLANAGQAVVVPPIRFVKGSAALFGMFP